MVKPRVIAGNAEEEEATKSTEHDLVVLLYSKVIKQTQHFDVVHLFLGFFFTA